MEDDVLVSVIIPCYNCEDYLVRSLGSIINQTYTNIEVIFVDDGSNDFSLEKAREIFDKCHIKYKIIASKNQGVSSARNIGIKYAKGKYVYFLDADDFIDKTLFEKVFTKVDTNPDAIIFGYNRVDDKNIIWKYDSNYKYINRKQNGTAICKAYLKQDISIHMCSIIFKNEIIKQNQLYFRTDCYYAEDVEFFLSGLLKCKNVFTIPEPLFNYYNRPNSAIRSFTERRFTGIDAFEGLSSYFKNHALSYDEELMFLINKRIVKEILFIYESFIYNNLNYRKERLYNSKIKTLINNKRDLFKYFDVISEEDKNLAQYFKQIISNYDLFTFFMCFKIRLKRRIKGFMNLTG